MLATMGCLGVRMWMIPALKGTRALGIEGIGQPACLLWGPRLRVVHKESTIKLPQSSPKVW